VTSKDEPGPEPWRPAIDLADDVRVSETPEHAIAAAPPLPRRWLVRFLAVVVIAVAIGVGGGIYLTAQAPPTEPRTTQAAEETLQLAFDRYDRGDYGGSWDLLSAAGKRVIGRDEYVRLHETCPVNPFNIEIVSSRLESADRAVVVVRAEEHNSTFSMHYEDGHWRLDPDPQVVKDYANGVDAIIAGRRGENSC
jgi:hypothetical protein